MERDGFGRPVDATAGASAAGERPAGAGPDGPMRYFQIGFQRCGTTSIALFFNRCGIPCVDYDEGRLAKRMRVNLEAGARPLEGYEDRYLAFTDLNWNAPDDYYDAFKHFGALRRAYGGRFILNTRPVEHWVRSLMTHKAQRKRRDLLAHYELRFGTTDLERVAQCWREEWDAHHRRVLAEVPAEELLVFDIESDPPEKLCDFIGVPRECARFYTHENATMNGFGRWLLRNTPQWVKRRTPKSFKRAVINRLRAR